MAGAAPWLERARRCAEASREWEDFTQKLFEAVQQQMAESHVNSFQDLSEAEKGFVLRKAAKAVQGGDSYRALMSCVSSCLEGEICRQIAQEMPERGDLVKNKPALLLSHLKDGVVSLLEKHPELKGRLRSFSNQPLPPDLRRLAWRLYLSDPKGRLGYLSQLAANRATSFRDREISLRCETILDSEPAFHSLKNNKAAPRILKNVLSYYHKLQGLSAPLQDQVYFLLVPLLQVLLDVASPSVSVDSVSALLVEEFVTFMKLRPDCDPNQASVVGKAASLLEQTDGDLTRFLESIYVQPGQDSWEALLKGLRRLLQVPLSTLFVGYLQMDTLLYIWDQIILGLEQPSYNCIPVFATVFLLLLKGQLLECQSMTELEATPKTGGPSLSVHAFQDTIRKHFFEELNRQLHRENEELFPVHDPTQTFPPWSYRAFRSVSPPRTKAEDRRRTREERELLQRQRVEKIEQQERLQKFREEEEKRQEEIRVTQLFEEAKRKFEMQKTRLEEQLSQERQIRYEMQARAEEQIGGLQAEINRLVEQKMLSSAAYSAGSLLAPAPSLESQTASQNSWTPFCWSQTGLKFKVIEDSRPQTGERQRTARTITLKLLEQMLEAAGTMVHGSTAEERERLDAATADHLRGYHQDSKNAKIEMFGFEISEKEIEEIPEPRRKEVRKKVEAALRRGVAARYKASQIKPPSAPVAPKAGR